MACEVDDLTKELTHTHLEEYLVSFSGQGLKLDNAEAAQTIIDKLNEAKCVETLELSGNTIGVEAAIAIGDALSRHPEIKRLLWKDTFTGRLKTEIAPALKGMTSALRTMPSVHLVELDLSDIAFGPNGVVGVTDLLASSACYSLEILKMDNEGLGHQGCRCLSTALGECLSNSRRTESAFRLRVFTAGRNRLENVGIKMLADVFSQMDSLEEFAVYQNGIGIHGVDGIHDLVRIISANHRLRKINVSDNTINPEGAEILVGCLGQLSNLQELNLSDCLLKDSGASSLADVLTEASMENLETLILSGNELTASSAVTVAVALHGKTKLKTLDLNSNELGSSGIQQVEQVLADSDQIDALCSFSDDEGSCGSEDEDGDEGEDDDTANGDDTYDSHQVEPTANKSLFDDLESKPCAPTIFGNPTGPRNPFGGSGLFDFKAASAAIPSTVEPHKDGLFKPSLLSKVLSSTSVAESDMQLFFDSPSMSLLHVFPDSSVSEFVTYLQKKQSEYSVHRLVVLATKIAALTGKSKSNNFTAELSTEILHLAFIQSPSSCLDVLLVELGLLKSEENKNKRKTCSPECLVTILSALTTLVRRNSMPSPEKMMLHCCLSNLWACHQSTESTQMQSARMDLIAVLSSA